MRDQLTLDDLQKMEHEHLLEKIEGVLADYDRPQLENQQQKMLRVGRTIDEMPEIYRWFMQLWSFCDHWTDELGRMFGTKAEQYKDMRQRRDLMEKAASTAKMRYESASRLVTLEMSFDPTGMPRQRRTDG
jgi:hypothetical protein